MSQELVTIVRHFTMHNLCVSLLILIFSQMYKVRNDIIHIWQKRKVG